MSGANDGRGIWVGTSGWSYEHWNGPLYSPDLRPWQRLDRYTAEFSTVELNASFYRWPTDRAFASWRRRMPEGFRLSVKAPRGLTHGKKLYSPELWATRIARSWHELGDKRAVLLVQLPPTMPRDDERLNYFLGTLPHWLRVAVELRHPSWNDPEVFDLLERHNAAYCVMSGANLPCVIRATSDIVYVRLHGPDHEYLYGGSYSDADLSWWADRASEWHGSGKAVYLYFNNDGGGNAVDNARTLRRLLTERGFLA
ncbi:DUF72 domain-containing protein [Subtercola lobariae]|uniref:Sensor histidine kinase n=1 Tax=Subtercola lobariae TaxID=1588641 RepID=A0A917ETZ4_9MICO|nr:DUF72 domain-containing protein [Subtercola lobariae]GGF15738.1 hypothetical protein GCM10011399_06970 [Subtercola lobariae]